MIYRYTNQDGDMMKESINRCPHSIEQGMIEEEVDSFSYSEVTSNAMEDVLSYIDNEAEREEIINAFTNNK